MVLLCSANRLVSEIMLLIFFFDSCVCIDIGLYSIRVSFCLIKTVKKILSYNAVEATVTDARPLLHHSSLLCLHEETRVRRRRAYSFDAEGGM